MLRLWRLLWFGDWHLHEWVADQSGNLCMPQYEMPTGRYVDCRCKTCGSWKRFELSA